MSTCDCSRCTWGWLQPDTSIWVSIMDLDTSEAFPYVSSLKAQLVDYELGLDNLLKNNQDQTILWDRLRSQLQILPGESEYTITHIFLAGESVTHPRFLACLRDSISELSLGPATAKIQLAIDPTFAAARGCSTLRTKTPGGEIGRAHV